MTAALRRSVHIVELAAYFAATAVVVGVLTLFGVSFVYDQQAAWAEFFDENQQVAWGGLFVLLTVLLRSVFVMRRRPVLASALLGSAFGLTLGVGLVALILSGPQS